MAQLGDSELMKVKKKMQQEWILDFHLCKDGNVWTCNRLCAPIEGQGYE